MIKVKSMYYFVALSLVVCFFSGCATTPMVVDETTIPSSKLKSKQYQKEADKKYEHIKDGTYFPMHPNTSWNFIIKGIIFLESKVTIDVNGDRTGSEITNYMLMKEAEKLGADDIINIRIDEREESKVIDTYEKENNNEIKFIKRKYRKITYYYRATALAIKYTTPVKDKISSENKSSTIIEKKESKNKK